MNALLLRAEVLARVEQRRVIERVASRVAGLLRGAEVRAGPDEVEVRSRGLSKRWLSDPALRFLTAGQQ